MATFHTSTTKSLVLSTFQGVLRPYHEKISGRIAVSELARRWQVEALGSDAVEIPNGVDVPAFADAPVLEGYPRAGRTVLFLGRFDEPRKGMAVLLGALPTLVESHPDIEILIDRRPWRRGQATQGRGRTRVAPDVSGAGRRCDQGIRDAQRRRLLRTQPRR